MFWIIAAIFGSAIVDDELNQLPSQRFWERFEPVGMRQDFFTSRPDDEAEGYSWYKTHR